MMKALSMFVFACAVAVAASTAEARKTGYPNGGGWQAVKKEFDEVDELVGAVQGSVDDLNGRVSDIQSTLDDPPIQDSLSAILSRLNELAEKIEEQSVDLAGVTQNWDKILDSTNGDGNGCNSERFTCLFPDAKYPDGAAVRDNETGLVFEREPSAVARSWFGAISHCLNRDVGGRSGWHLAMATQLMSLRDSSNNSPPLPNGHPFVFTDEDSFWTANTNVFSQAEGLFVTLQGDGGVGAGFKDVDSRFGAWCVRGGQAVDGVSLFDVVSFPLP